MPFALDHALRLDEGVMEAKVKIMLVQMVASPVVAGRVH